MLVGTAVWLLSDLTGSVRGSCQWIKIITSIFKVRFIIVVVCFILSLVDLNIQLRLRVNSNCGQYILSETVAKTTDITSELIQGVSGMRGCGFNSTLISRPFIRCFDDSPQLVTYRAVLTGTLTASTVELVSLIDQWIAMTETIIVQSTGLSIDSTCPLVIVDRDSPECSQDLTNRSSVQLEGTTPMLEVGAIVGGAAGGLVGLVAIVTLVLAAVVLSHRLKHRE